jgi:hypothetical protein
MVWGVGPAEATGLYAAAGVWVAPAAAMCDHTAAGAVPRCRPSVASPAPEGWGPVAAERDLTAAGGSAGRAVHRRVGAERPETS